MGSGQAYCPTAGRLQICALRSYWVQNWHCPPLEILLPHHPPLVLAQETGTAVLLMAIFSAFFSPLLLFYCSSCLVLQVLNSDTSRDFWICLPYSSSAQQCTSRTQLSCVQKLLMPLHLPKGNKLMSQHHWVSWLRVCEPCPQFPLTATLTGVSDLVQAWVM